jgi:ribA/ribD-fused uncharacterized protein
MRQTTHRDDFSRTETGAWAPLTVKKGFAFFWGQWPSNWEPAYFELNGSHYSCVEQHMMAEKARLFKDKATLDSIMKTHDPDEQKRLGRSVKGYDEATWARVRYNIVLQGTLEKYRQNHDLRSELLGTDDLVFVEASPYDNVWGIVMRSDDAGATDPTKWKGQNLLGQCISQARAIIRSEQ